MKAIDLHCDTIFKIYQTPAAQLRENEFQIDLRRMKESGTVLQNFAMFVQLDEVDDPYRVCREMIACYQAELEKNTDLIRPITTMAEYEANQQAGLLSSLLTMEEGAPLAGRLDRLQEFYDLGVRMLTLTWNFENEIGYPNAVYWNDEQQSLASQQQGLTEKGISIVRRMEELGMMIDVSHGSDQLVRDVLTYTKRPFVASHSNARAICNHSRNLTDELIRGIADRGGVIGMNYYEAFIRPEGSQQSLVEGLIDHIKHFVQVGGVDCIGLGSDFDGIEENPELADIRAIEKIELGLQAAGFTTSEIEKIFYQNVERLYREFLT
ncbi:dipeptidase [Enterococcus sp. 669A]|uniref:Dipeptidase n=1 Tax=Candidatus Enterococcus moelleringii TaxID=2815325 RepID=A0ABS3L899_9ENTE|nr:dipeptidase [Enterococcus sp. 669A]MBO1305842.1 dipeptidase [Enterococcus sp. 669A]